MKSISPITQALSNQRAWCLNVLHELRKTKFRHVSHFSDHLTLHERVWRGHGVEFLARHEGQNLGGPWCWAVPLGHVQWGHAAQVSKKSIWGACVKPLYHSLEQSLPWLMLLTGGSRSRLVVLLVGLIGALIAWSIVCHYHAVLPAANVQHPALRVPFWTR